MLTFTPDNFASSYSCGICGISCQVLYPATDENGTPLVRDDGSPVMIQDEEPAMAELTEHITTEHPSGPA